MSKDLISVVIPMYLEEAVALECYKRLFSVLEVCDFNYELIFVNDGSKDRTLTILEGIACINPKAKIISLSRNFGHQAAITVGIKKSLGDAVVVIDADLQDPPELIPCMVELWREGYEVIYARRKQRNGESWFKLVAAKYFYRFLNWMSDTEIPIDTGDFRLIDRKVVNAFLEMPEKARFVRGMISWVGFRQIPIEYERDVRFAGKTKYSMKKMLKFAMDGILTFSTKPLKAIGVVGLLITMSAISIFSYSLIYSVIGHQVVSEWLSLISALILIGGLQLLAISLLGEYIGRIYEQSKGRPLYIIDKELNFCNNSSVSEGVEPIFSVEEQLN